MNQSIFVITRAIHTTSGVYSENVGYVTYKFDAEVAVKRLNEEYGTDTYSFEQVWKVL